MQREEKLKRNFIQAINFTEKHDPSDFTSFFVLFTQFVENNKEKVKTIKTDPFFLPSIFLMVQIT